MPMSLKIFNMKCPLMDDRILIEKRVMKLRITLADGRFEYDAQTIDAGGRYYYRIGDTTIEVTRHEYDRVIGNPRLYYFSTAVKLHKVIQRGLRRNVKLSLD